MLEKIEQQPLAPGGPTRERTDRPLVSEGERKTIKEKENEGERQMPETERLKRRDRHREQEKECWVLLTG